MAGIYVHIPFCKSRCIYCDFYSTTNYKWQDRYINALIKEMNLQYNYLKNDPIETLYIGGGTPSQLSLQNILLLFEGLNSNKFLNNVIESTFECNPDDISFNFIENLVSRGVNRISMGAQSFSNDRLKFLKRRHNAQQIRDAVKILRNFGIKNISIDLIFGFPGETLNEWIFDIEEALSLEVEHISAYSLMYEKGTLLYNMLEKGLVKEIDEDLSREMYYTLIDKLKMSGYEHYEISNFARKGFISLHNSSYWKEVPYLGLGAGAHSYNRTSRQWNVDDIGLYVKKLEQNEVPFQKEIIDGKTKYNDMITTALRTSSGIEIDKCLEYREYLLKNAKRSIENNFLKVNDGHIHLTREGLFVSDDVMSDLIFTD